MPTTTWDETAPDGDVITVSLLDDSIRDTKKAVRERMEGDSDYTGIFEAGSFATGPKPKQGSARIYATPSASIAGLVLENGRLAIATDTNRLYHLAAAGLVELGYVALDGSRTLTGNLALGSHKITGLAAATVAGDAVRYEQAAIIDQARTISGLWTFNRGAGVAPFAVGDPTVVPSLNADLLDGNHASAFAAAAHTHDASAIVSGTLATGRGGTGLTGYATGDVLYAVNATTLGRLAAGSAWKVLAGGTLPSWKGNLSQEQFIQLFSITSAAWTATGYSQAIEAGAVYVVTFDVIISELPTSGCSLQVVGPTGSNVRIGWLAESASGRAGTGTNSADTGTLYSSGAASRAARVFAFVDNTAGVAGNIILNGERIGVSGTFSADVLGQALRVS